MASVNLCPECGKRLLATASRCSCGWIAIADKVNHPDHNCCYVVSGKRCPLPGTMNPYAYGSRNHWYCRRHYKTLNNPRLAEEELHFIEENYQQILNAEYSCWRKALFKNTGE